MPEFLINETRNQYVQLVFGIPDLYFLRQVTKIWDIHNDTLSYEYYPGRPEHLESMNRYIDRYN